MNAAAAIAALLAGRTLSTEEAAAVMHGIADGAASPAQIGALLALLHQRGETVDEITGFARVLRQRVVRVQAASSRLLDTCGTGGDGHSTFNISTLAAVVAAAGGVTVAKHGNRSVSSRVGSADLLEALGVRIELPVEAVEACLRDTGFAFLYAPLYHPALRHAAGPRRELGVRTVFNILGPLANPAGADHQLLGVYEPGLVEKLAQVLRALGARRGLVVHGEDGTDEISACGPTLVAELRDGRIEVATWRPQSVGVEPLPLARLRGGDLQQNVALASRVLDGEAGPLQDAVALNAGAALYVAEAAPTWAAGVSAARDILASGRARAQVEAIAAHTQRLAAS